MATRARNGSSNLAAAMTLLIQTQAQAVNDMARMRKEFAAIREDLDMIKAVLARHERILEKLPDVIRQKIGFKGE